MTFWQRIRRFWRADIFSPRGFLLRAGVIGAAFLALHLAGLRDYASVLNGTVGPASTGWKTSAFLGVAYLVVYMALVILAPILILAAGILSLWHRRRRQQ
jgi:hypothetical protein